MRSICAAMLMLLVFGISGCGGAPAAGPVGRIDPKEADHKEREMVRDWLRENTDSGKWEEVKWWPVKVVKPGTVLGLQMEEEEPFVRVKFRTVNGGDKYLSDRIFSFRGGKSQPPHSAIEEMLFRAFP